MATIKSYTDIEQSRKLEEILPLESADMWWSRCTITDFGDGVLKVSYAVEPCNISQFRNTKEDIPCWSLAALFGVLPTIDDEFKPQLHRSLDKYFCTYEGEEDSSGLWRVADNPVDACYEMIIKLHEFQMLRL